jgi:hypothetical protein
MKRFAIDIVLLPPEPVMNIILEWNKNLVKNDGRNLMLNKHDFLPHISMVMGCLSSDKLSTAQKILQSIITNHSSLELQASAVRMLGTADHRIVATMDIAVNAALIELHESIVNAFRSLLTQDANELDLFESSDIDHSTLKWINDFIPHQCFENFWPHITLGFGEPTIAFKPFAFQVTRIAICHLGNHCTCRKILAEESLAVTNPPRWTR